MLSVALATALPNGPPMSARCRSAPNPDHPPKIRQTGTPLETAFAAPDEGGRSRDYGMSERKLKAGGGITKTAALAVFTRQ